MPEYTFAEYTDMLLIYGEARRNGREAQRLYHEYFPNRVPPSHVIFARVEQRLRDSGKFTDSRANCGAPRRQRTVAFEEDVLHQIEENPSTSTRAIARDLNASQTSVWRVLHEQQLHPYHPQKVHAMSPADFVQRVNFCTWFLHRCLHVPQFPRRILFTDEAHFNREGVLNARNSHIWDQVNPKATCPRRFQHTFGINVWAGIIDGRLIGPYILPPRLTGARYLIFLQQVLAELLEAVPLDMRQQMWFQHDGAPAHFHGPVRNHLNAVYGERWIGRGGPHPWPPRSPDLTPLDFFLWGHMKSLVYETPVQSEEDLVARIMAAAEVIHRTPRILDRVYENLLRRYTVCNEFGGRHIEQLL